MARAWRDWHIGHDRPNHDSLGMTTPGIIPLPERAVITLEGMEIAAFLQGLISADTQKMQDGQSSTALLLTAQGRWVHDFFLLRHNDHFLIECEAKRADDLIQRLSRYILGRDIVIQRADLHVAACLNTDHTIEQLRTETSSNHVIQDPRPAPMGFRLWRVQPFAAADDSSYDQRRLQSGLSEGSRDLEPEKSIPAEYNFDYLDSLDWNKGCYMGQEGVARIYYRGLVRKRILPFTMKQDDPPPLGSVILAGGKTIGITRSARRFGQHIHGLALLRSEDFHHAHASRTALEISGTTIDITIPDWFAEAEAKTKPGRNKPA